MLTIADHLPWNGAHLATLQEKLNTYLRFLESGEVYASYPMAKGRKLEINVVAKFRPTQEALRFLERAGGTIQSAGFEFRYGPAAQGYEGDD